jgi:copper(I)-binding protein
VFTAWWDVPARGGRAGGVLRAGGDAGAVRLLGVGVPEDRHQQRLQPTTPGTTVAYMDIRNNAKTTDRLVAATTSVGGRVSFLAPDGMTGSGTMIMKTVSDISIPSQAIVRMNPNSFRLRITGAGTMQGGKDVIITLRFAHAGKVSVVALVTNPASGGGSYFLN